MAGIADIDSPQAGAVRKVLRLLGALRESQAGNVLYRQVEHMLGEWVSTNQATEQSYAAIAATLLDVYASRLAAGSPLLVQVKLLRARLQPPLVASDLQALQQYVEAYREQISQTQDADQVVFAAALQPLLRAFGITGVADSAAGMNHSAMSPPVAVGMQSEQATATSEYFPPESENTAYNPEFKEEPRNTVRPDSDERHPLDGLGGMPTLTRQLEPEDINDEGMADPDLNRTTAYKTQLDARRRDIQELQAGLAQQVLDTIAQNQEFGVLLEVVLSELRQVGEVTDMESFRWTLIREIEKLMSGHHELADKLDSTHHYLQVVESDSRQLTDELTRARLLSLTDELTGLPNRRAFLRRIEDEVARVQRYGFPLALALIDLDKFKEINDKYGHAGGDEVLRVYSKNILSIFRHHDLVARYGGEEFAVLLPNTEKEGSLRALNKVKQRCAETRWQSNGSVVSVPTFSAGLALYKPGETSTAFVERVDKALYRAKRLGRNRVEIDMTYQTESESPVPPQKGAEPS